LPNSSASDSPQFEIKPVRNFTRSLKKISKFYNKDFDTFIAATLQALIKNPYPKDSAQEPLPAQGKLPEAWTLHKLRLNYGKRCIGQDSVNLFGE
jgi:hypothetical protein